MLTPVNDRVFCDSQYQACLQVCNHVDDHIWQRVEDEVEDEVGDSVHHWKFYNGIKNTLKSWLIKMHHSNDFLDSVRTLLTKKLLKIYYPNENFLTTIIGLIFFDEVPSNIQCTRDLNDEGSGCYPEWFLITDRPRGLEYKEEMAYYYGIIIVEVENMDLVRTELEKIAGDQTN